MAKGKRQKAKVENPKPELVICFVGKRREIDKRTGKEKLVLREAPARRVNGQRIFDLPSDSDQKKGFTHPDAELLLRLYPQDFKKKTPKGKQK